MEPSRGTRWTGMPPGANALIEIRQDLIASEDGAAEWAARFARLLRPLLSAADLRVPAPTPTRTRERLRRH